MNTSSEVSFGSGRPNGIKKKTCKTSVELKNLNNIIQRWTNYGLDNSTFFLDKENKKDISCTVHLPSHPRIDGPTDTPYRAHIRNRRKKDRLSPIIPPNLQIIVPSLHLQIISDRAVIRE